jgi:hypothetical protein
VLATLPLAAHAATARFVVRVESTKPNGQNWDAGYADMVLPDIEVAVAGSPGVWLCQDDTRCETDSIEVPEGSIIVTVFDADLSMKDSIGKARCTSDTRSCAVTEGPSLLSVEMR